MDPQEMLAQLADMGFDTAVFGDGETPVEPGPVMAEVLRVYDSEEAPDGNQPEGVKPGRRTGDDYGEALGKPNPQHRTGDETLEMQVGKRAPRRVGEMAGRSLNSERQRFASYWDKQARQYGAAAVTKAMGGRQEYAETMAKSGMSYADVTGEPGTTTGDEPPMPNAGRMADGSTGRRDVRHVYAGRGFSERRSQQQTVAKFSERPDVVSAWSKAGVDPASTRQSYAEFQQQAEHFGWCPCPNSFLNGPFPNGSCNCRR